MIVLHINSEKDVHKIDELIEKGNDVFILIYMEGCGPCNAVRPEWAKLEHALKQQYANNDKLVIVDVNKDFLSKIKNIDESKIVGFPTMKYFTNYGKKIEDYDNSSFLNKGAKNVDTFINWIDSKIKKVVSAAPASTPFELYKRLSNPKSYKKHRKHNRKSKKHNKKSRKHNKKSRKHNKKSRKHRK
jgi:thiol-disulfide isomerase/thioredoxin